MHLTYSNKNKKQSEILILNISNEKVLERNIVKVILKFQTCDHSLGLYSYLHGIYIERFFFNSILH